MQHTGSYTHFQLHIFSVSILPISIKQVGLSLFELMVLHFLFLGILVQSETRVSFGKFVAAETNLPSTRLHQDSAADVTKLADPGRQG